MKRTTQTINLFTLLALIFVSIVALSPQAPAASASEIDRAARSALRDLYAINPKAKAIGSRAAAVLVFPSIRKGGLLVAAQHGDGALISGGRTTGYYQTLAASYGLQAGVQKFGYALFFINQKAMAHLHDHGGWELGSAPSLVVVDQGVSKSLSTTNLKKDIYAFFFSQKGLMGGLGFQGSKITEIHPD
jgi:lipid-binding SYLF domain-containing protein